MYKELKICEKNKNEIETALYEINGDANAHTITSYSKVEKLAAHFEYRLERAFLPIKFRAGATAVIISGDKVANSYKFRRQATRIKIVRKSTAWYLCNISQEMIYVEGGKKTLTLTDEQKNEAVTRFLRQI